MGDYTTNTYQGGYSSLKSNYGDVFTGYHTPAGSLGLTTDPRSANIVKEVSGKLASGVKKIEVEWVSPKVFDAIPKQQLKEVNQISKLTGIDISVHGPVIDTVGINQQGFSEINRENSERVITRSIKTSQELDPRGNIPIVFHTTEGIQGTEWETLGKERKAKKMIAVNRQTGQMVPLEAEKRYYPDMPKLKPGVEQKYQAGKITAQEIGSNKAKYYSQVPLEIGKIISPEESIKMQNTTKWDDDLSQLLFNKERADEILQRNKTEIEHLMPALQSGRLKPKDLTPIQKQTLNHLDNAEAYLGDTDQHLSALFSQAYKYGSPKQKQALVQIKNNYQDVLNKQGREISGKSDAMQVLINELKDSRNELAPDMFVPIEKFATEQSSKTFGNAAFKAYKKFGDKAPVVCIENPPVGHALATGQDLKNLVVESRKKFVENAVKEGIGRSEAKASAEKLIGATWDVGHINMLRGQGFGDKEIIKETEIVAPFVKHVHFSDNFGFEHTELPMGMGNVPLKEIMKKLGKKGYEARKIIEVADWFQHFKTSPFKESLQGVGSPIYSDGVGPYWNQAIGLQQSYSVGYGQMLPSMHYETFGAGFSQLPAELGGQRGGGQGSRMSGKGME